jgi:Xaa-Pro aminopeptidase
MEGFRQCNIRDGAALIRYFAWLQEVLERGEQWTEHDAAEQLEAFRRCVTAMEFL